MRLKQVLTWAVVLFFAFYAVTDPAAVVHVGDTVLGGLKSAGADIARLLNSI